MSPGEDVVAERLWEINMKVLMKAMRKMMVGRQLSNEKKHGCLGHVGDYTAKL